MARPVIQQVTVLSETSIHVRVEAYDYPIYQLWISTDNGTTWILQDVRYASTTFETDIVGLQPGATYSVITKIQSTRLPEPETRYSNTETVTTYKYPYAIPGTNFNISDSDIQTNFYNPLQRNISCELLDDSNSVVATFSTDGEVYWVRLGSTIKDALYQSIPNAQTGTYKIRVTYAGNVDTKNCGFYRATDWACSPDFGTIEVYDNNPDTRTLTQHDYEIIQNNSLARFTVSDLQAKNSASIVSCSVEVLGTSTALTISGSTASGGNFTIDSANNVIASVTLTDSRGFSTTKTVEVQMIAYSFPSASCRYHRENNYYTPTDLSVAAKWSDIYGNNTVYVTVNISRQGGSTYTDSDSSSSSPHTFAFPTFANHFSLDYNYAWTATVTLTDSLNNSTTYTFVIPRGTPIIFFDQVKSSVGVNCFPQDDRSLEVDGVNIMDALFFKPGDTISFANYPVHGYVWNSATYIEFVIPVGKNLGKITTIKFKTLTGSVKKAGTASALEGSTDLKDWTTTTYELTATKENASMIRLRISKKDSSAMSGATNASSVNLWIKSGLVTLS